MKRTRIRNKSEKKKLRDKIGRLHLEILKYERNNFDTDEITGQKVKVLGRFHILPVGQYPRLEFVSENILLTGWFSSHYYWHHDYEKAKIIEKRIKELRGEDYKERLKIRNAIMPKMTMFYLRSLYAAFKVILKQLKRQRGEPG